VLVLSAHYSIPLPGDYDMGRIRDRVASKASYWDRRDGLLLKAFCMTERGDLGAVSNSYAPFYVWSDPAALHDFLTGAEYAGLAAAFGAVAVHLTTPLHVTVGDGEPPCAVRMEVEHLAMPADLAALQRAEEARVQVALGSRGVHSHVVTLDSASWTIARYTLLREPLPLAEGSDDPRVGMMRVIHLSTPRSGKDLRDTP